MRRVHPSCRWLALVFLLTIGPLRAADAPSKGFFERDSPLPDPGGLRAKLADDGVAFTLIYAVEYLCNPLGGYRQGGVYDGLLTLGLDVDLEKLAGLKGLKFHALTYDTHGASGTTRYTRDLNNFSNIDAPDAVKLFEGWLEESLWGNAVNLRLGQLAADTEFSVTQGGALFFNGAFGDVPLVPVDVPEPSFPYAAPGVRLRLNSPGNRFYFQGGVYSGNPNADRLGDPDPGFRAGTAYNDDGVRFPISGNQGLYSVYEAGFLLNKGRDATGLPGTYRVGGFFRSAPVADQRSEGAERSPGDPLPAGRLRAHGSDGGVYAVADQVVYRRSPLPGQLADVAQTASAPVGNAEDSPPGAASTALPPGPELRVFGRLGFAPEDRNPADFYAEAGCNYRSLLPGRDRDVCGLAFTYTDLSDDLRRAQREANRLHGTRNALSDYEAVLEGTYQVNLAPWLSVQPDVQFIIHPGGSPRNDDALVIGARTVVAF